MGKVRKFIFVIALLVFIGSAGYLLQHYLKGKAEQNEFESLRVNGGHNLEALYKENPDIVGWVQIKDSIIDYPVMQTKDDPEFYLRRNFKKEDSLAGTPFLDAQSDLTRPSWNWMIYAHNMKNGTMFHTLLDFEKKEYYDKRKTFTFDTLDQYGGPAEYEIVAAFYTQIYPEDSKEFKYYDYVDVTSEEVYNEYVRNIKAQSIYDTGITPEYGQQLVTLSTCSYQVEDGRFVVVGRKIEK